MTTALYKKLACPFDKTSPLKLTTVTKKGDKIIEGLLECPQCRRYYPIIYGIPVMSPDEYREHKMEIPILKRWESYLGENIKPDDQYKLPPKNDVEKK